MIYKDKTSLLGDDNANPQSASTRDDGRKSRDRSRTEYVDSEVDNEYSLEYDHDEDDGDVEHFDDDYDLDDDDENEDINTDQAKKEAGQPSPWRLLLKMMLNPVEGWKSIRRTKDSVENVSARLFYPVSAASAASCFLSCLYDSSITLSAATIEAVKVFVTFFFGNFIILMLERISLPGEYKKIPDSAFGKEFVIYALTTLAIFNLLYQALPMLGPVLAFLPLWTIYLVIRGSRFFRFSPAKKHLCVTLICLYIIGAPIAVYWIFDMIL